jgi:hypothetical protein
MFINIRPAFQDPLKPWIMETSKEGNCSKFRIYNLKFIVLAC